MLSGRSEKVILHVQELREAANSVERQMR